MWQKLRNARLIALLAAMALAAGCGAPGVDAATLASVPVG